jgi:SAM-dependent methyltransferase
VREHPEFVRLARDHQWDLHAILEPAGDVWRCRGAAPVSTAYSDAHHAERDEALTSSWWYRTRNAMLLDLLDSGPRPAAIWDVGAGTGSVSRTLVAAGIPSIAVEPSPEGARFAAAHGLTAVVGTLHDLELPDASVRAVGLFDVLEHVADRPALLAEIRRVLRPDGALYLSVPAGVWLWSGFDADEGHALRYSRARLLHELQLADFVVERVVHAFALLVVPIALGRALPYRLELNRVVDHERAVRASGGLLGALLGALERRLVGRVPFGSSLLAVARRAT